MFVYTTLADLELQDFNTGFMILLECILMVGPFSINVFIYLYWNLLCSVLLSKPLLQYWTFCLELLYLSQYI